MTALEQLAWCDVGRSRAHLLLAGAAAALPPVSLDDAIDSAGLLTRVDNKYLVPLGLLDRFIRSLDGTFWVLDIAAQRVFGYESVYFDTEDYALFGLHAHGRRRRYKVRTRTYLDTGGSMFEVKLKGGRGETVKSRIDHPVEAKDDFTPTALQFLHDTLREQYGADTPCLRPRIRTTYRRATLVDLAGGARVTCDVDLRCSDLDTEPASGVRADGVIVVETKTANGRGPADLALRHLGLRPVRMSKYCMAVALLNPHLPANRWNRTLRLYYGYERAVPA